MGPLKLFYAQFEELESFSKFGVQLDEETQHKLDRGKAIRSVLQQIQYKPMDVATQIAVFTAVNHDLFDHLDDKQISKAQVIIQKVLHQKFKSLIQKITAKRQRMDEKEETMLISAFQEALKLKEV